MNEPATISPILEPVLASEPSSIYVRRHLRIGWAALLGYLSLGIVLEALHGFKVEWYLSVGNETRRLMWTLAHAHGDLIGLIHIAFAFTVARLAAGGVTRWRVPSIALTASTLLLPGGFFLGGLVTYGADPGRGILLVPLGAAALLIAVAMTLWSLLRS
jgi:hypothetical protein